MHSQVLFRPASIPSSSVHLLLLSLLLSIFSLISAAPQGTGIITLAKSPFSLTELQSSVVVKPYGTLQSLNFTVADVDVGDAPYLCAQMSSNLASQIDVINYCQSTGTPSMTFSLTSWQSVSVFSVKLCNA